MKGQYIQFFTKSKTNPNFHMLIEDEGNTQTLDGRFSLGKCCSIATDLCRKKANQGFRIMVKKRVIHPEGDYNTQHHLTECWKVFPNSIEC
ncbi:hypothetical protein NVP1161O_123 [Vibrio phage 1.161.O._10N.261.48.C5]|nr:hypothetical protein NVP1161O_123 [Vibrio phage 1.161.O._10N.261.48.C5]